jgi:transcriptional regulator with XRE-family HTH domain
LGLINYICNVNIKIVFTMVNTEEFILRMEQILQFYGLSASAFADRIGVQRSSVSHLLSGRNKPSLDFVMKICDEFQDVDLYWFLQGKGQFPKSGSHVAPTHLFQESLPIEKAVSTTSPSNVHETIQKVAAVQKVENASNNLEDLTSDEFKKNDIASSNTHDQMQAVEPHENAPTNPNQASLRHENRSQEPLSQNVKGIFQEHEVDKIVVFYKDGTFKAYRARE